jgi:hypothetical protein
MTAMTYEEEARIAQQVLDRLASQGAMLPRPSSGAREAQVNLSGVGYSVHRHGSDLRFSQRTDLRHREVGRYLIVSIGEHRGGWMVARSVRPPGEYHDERAAESARQRVEQELAQIGHDVGTPGMGGRRKTTRELEADVRAILVQPTSGQPIARHPTRRARRR